ncbi:MAG: flp pilus-assembly TadE/G-like family protein [Mycolicibacterium sp.]|nr:flp pilus-assembly TadE/G-like family protein [Mycolicibacterium sp.]
MSSPGLVAVRSCCPGCSSPRKPSRLPSRVSDDAGAVTVLAAVLVAALVTIALGGIWLGAAEVARHRAQAVADLAALAAAGRLTLGPDVACRQADQLAAAMRATVRGCAVEHLDVVVTVAVRMGGRISFEARAAARAGPSGTG